MQGFAVHVLHACVPQRDAIGLPNVDNSGVETVAASSCWSTF
jgi:hypothetical protein